MQVREKIWDMSYKEGRTWILQNVFQVEPKRRCKVKPTDDVTSGELKRKCVRNYTLQRVPVCMKMFMNTLCYSADNFLTIALGNSVTEKIEVHQRATLTRKLYTFLSIYRRLEC